MPTRAMNSSFRNSSEYIHAEILARKNAIAAGKPLRQNPVYSNFEQSVLGRDVVKTLKEAITKIEKREGAKQLATNLRKYHKI